MGGEVHIDIYDDRVELVSPGAMLDGTQIQDRDIYKVPSMRRNPVIADMFTQLDYMEKRGSPSGTTFLPSAIFESGGQLIEKILSLFKR